MDQQAPDEFRPGLPIVQLESIRLILERLNLGIERYGTPLQPFNGRDARRDLIEELLDALFYVTQLYLEEKDRNQRLAG